MTHQKAIHVLYKNYEGKISLREIVPHSVEFGENKWHKGKQWLMNAWDQSRKANRTYAMDQMDFVARGKDVPTKDLLAFMEQCELAWTKHKDGSYTFSWADVPGEIIEAQNETEAREFLVYQFDRCLARIRAQQEKRDA